MTYHRITTRLLGIAAVLGPVLTALSAAVYMLGIGTNPGLMGWGSSIEGIIGYYAYILLIPPFVALARHLGQAKPYLAAVAVVAVLFGFAGGAVMNMSYRVMIPDLMDAGMTVEMLNRLQDTQSAGQSTPGFMAIVFTGLLCPLSSILLGIGFLRSAPLRGGALVLAGLLFPMGQFLVQGLLYFIATLLWAVVLVPLGIRLLRGTPDGPLLEPNPAAGEQGEPGGAWN